MVIAKLFGIACLVLGVLCGYAEGKPYRVVFYNVENLFDIEDDSVTDDAEFTPEGSRHWTGVRYRDKLCKLAQVLDSVGGDMLPAFIGMAEVENDRVLNDLTQKTSLVRGNYGVVHQDSPDRRGIDVAFLYRKDYFKPVHVNFFPVAFSEDTTFRTRDILYVSGVLGDDTLHFFVCHFPSMREGEEQTEWRRVGVASVICSKIDSLQAISTDALVVVMGDMNGKADTKAQKALGAVSSDDPLKNGQLYNTGYYLLHEEYGSYRYRGTWQTLNHIIVSESLLTGQYGIKADRRLTVFSASFLLEEDHTYLGYKPKPTYRGPRYVGGYSDHLPVFLNLYH